MCPGLRLAATNKNVGGLAEEAQRPKQGTATGGSANQQGALILLRVVVMALGTGLLVFSQTLAWYGDEGWHLLAAQLINAGKRPYIDFFYQHTPLYAYLNAGWMRVFGESWRSAHALSALLTGTCIMLVASFVFTRLREPGWRLAGGITVALLLGLYLPVIRFGTIGQAYGLCLFLIVASFRLVIEAMDREKGILPAWAGLCAGAAAASSLLAAPVAPILLLWMVRHNRAKGRLKKCAQFLGGTAIPFLPLLWLAVQFPRQVLFNVVEYHLFYRAVGFSTKALAFHNLGVLTAWLNSAQGLLLVLLAAVGLLFLGERSEWDTRRRAEFSLCAWLTGGLGVYLATPYPTYPQYFVLMTPFLAILASVGAYAIGSRVWTSGRPRWLVLALLGLFTLGLAKSAYQQRQYFVPYWQEIEEFAQEINQVTPNDGLVYADEAIYFAARRLPPHGLENSNAFELRLPPAFAASLHVVSQSQVDEWLREGYFATAWIEANDPKVESLHLPRLYARSRKLRCYTGDCYIFWNRVARPREPS